MGVVNKLIYPNFGAYEAREWILFFGIILLITTTILIARFIRKNQRLEYWVRGSSVRQTWGGVIPAASISLGSAVAFVLLTPEIWGPQAGAVAIIFGIPFIPFGILFLVINITGRVPAFLLPKWVREYEREHGPLRKETLNQNDARNREEASNDE